MKPTGFGPHAQLLRFAERPDEAAFRLGQALVTELERQRPAGLRELVPAFTTLLLEFAPGAPRGVEPDWARLLELAQAAAQMEVAGRTVEMPVHYAGPDLGRVAEQARLAPEEVIARHSAADYRVHCLGFAPGFPYLGGLDPRLHTPRLATPRPRVAAGSVAIGGEHAGIYSIPSPGGWNLIGQTSETLFNPRGATVEELFRLRAGDRVRFVPVTSLPAQAEAAAEPWVANSAASVLRVLAPGLGLSVQDLGRPGFRRFGVPASGAMDAAAAAWANRLLDNPSGAAVLELCLQGQRLEVLRTGWLAVTGSAAPRGHVPNQAFRVQAGDVLEFPPGATGVWSYLAVPGGVAAETVLGSASANPRAGIGTSLAAGAELAVTKVTNLNLPSAVAARAVPWGELGKVAEPVPLRVWPGPQWERFTDADRERFFTEDWTLSSQCDRVGYRLQGPSLIPDSAALISEPVLPGSIQVPANGQPIVTMADGPTLGGYPKLGLVDPGDLARLAQLRTGQRVRFVPVSQTANQPGSASRLRAGGRLPLTPGREARPQL